MQWGIVIDLDEVLLSANPDRQESWSDFVTRQERNHASLREPLNAINFKVAEVLKKFARKLIIEKIGIITKPILAQLVTEL